MSAIDKYIVRGTLQAFLIVLVSLTGIIWITQALRGLDLMTSQGQTILVFFGVTGLAIPLLAMIIAPIALLIAVMYTLNRLATESEIIVMNAAGLSPSRFLRPFMIATVTVSVFVAFLSLYLAPQCLRDLKQWQAEIGADVLTNILRPGEFAKLGGLTIRISERLPGGVLTGIFIDDQRNPAERIDIIAERGAVQKNERGSVLVLQDGNLQRFETGKRDPALVAFKSYAFDLSQFSNAAQNVTYGTRERSTWNIAFPDPNDPVINAAPGAFRAELHDRFFAPLYPFAFVLLAFAVLGPARTTRQTRNFAIAVLIFGILAVRITGFGLSTVSAAIPGAIVAQYLLLALTCLTSIVLISRGLVIDAPTRLIDYGRALLSRLIALRPI
ncbi:MAG: LPS export ABC transporter permease LptF [Afipia sp.]|nr:LPS export ABC transporter permease LptF [Afipia sp.]